MPARPRHQTPPVNASVAAEAHRAEIDSEALMKRLRVLKELGLLLRALRARSIAQSAPGLEPINPGILP